VLFVYVLYTATEVIFIVLQLKELHSQGYSLLSIDASGQTALHYGSCYGHKDIVKYLIACAPASILNMADNDKWVLLGDLFSKQTIRLYQIVLMA
jgi:ankyrin repeat protein